MAQNFIIYIVHIVFSYMVTGITNRCVRLQPIITYVESRNNHCIGSSMYYITLGECMEGVMLKTN